MRWVWSIAIVLLAGVPVSGAQVSGADAETGRGAVDRAQLIEGVREIGAPGAPSDTARASVAKLPAWMPPGISPK